MISHLSRFCVSENQLANVCFLSFLDFTCLKISLSTRAFWIFPISRVRKFFYQHVVFHFSYFHVPPPETFGTGFFTFPNTTYRHPKLSTRAFSLFLIPRADTRNFRHGLFHFFQSCVLKRGIFLNKKPRTTPNRVVSRYQPATGPDFIRII